ncbi:MAG: hypothetical protein J5988_04220, partial [Eubacterium sp.]|nr:hypothetical protein [Eubacterium sp.]
FYLKKGNKRSEVVSRTVKDVTAPEAPKVKCDGSLFCVKGEVGTKIYFKGENGWRYLGIMLNNKWKSFIIGLDIGDTDCEYYEVYLKDAAGNKSKIVKIKNPEPGVLPEVN